MKKTYHGNTAYFGASNSFQGFKSNFDKIFDANRFERIYILKGGPGTGKSTLMRSVAAAFETGDHCVTEIYCSSDTSSLDGVIIEKSGKRVAIIDGTAPHITDPSVPGAIDEIVNLGEAFDVRSLVTKKDEILLLNSYKKAHYKSAYSYLSLAGEVNSKIWDIILNSLSYSAAEHLIIPIIEAEIKPEIAPESNSNYHISAFGKDGYTRLNIPCIKKEYFSIIGDGFSEYFLMNLVLNKLFDIGSVSMVLPSPLTKTMTDAIITDSSVISCDSIGNNVIDTTELFSSLPDEYCYLTRNYRDLLAFASSEFLKASEAHAALEKIYTANMNFAYNEKMRERIIDEAGEYLL